MLVICTGYYSIESGYAKHLWLRIIKPVLFCVCMKYLSDYKGFIIYKCKNKSNMKKITLILTIVATLFATTSCGMINSMSYDEAYDFGYNLGSAARYLIDN